jgi:hypothetical protein
MSEVPLYPDTAVERAGNNLNGFHDFHLENGSSLVLTGFFVPNSLSNGSPFGLACAPIGASPLVFIQLVRASSLVSHRMYSLISFRKSPPPRDRQLSVYCY